MKDKLKVGIGTDAFPPTTDGISNVAQNYASQINDKLGEAVVITPKNPNQLDYKYEGGGKTYRSGKGERGREAASSFICVGKSDSLSFPFSIVAYYRVGSYIVWLSNMW